MKKDYLNNARILILATLIIWFASYSAASRDYYLDLKQHANWALNLNRHNLFEFMASYIAYPLWHILLRVIHEFNPYSNLVAGTVATALLNSFSLWSVIYIWNKVTNKPLSFGNIAFFSTCLLFVGPLYIPSYNPFYYLGQGSGNIWHNPTHIAVKGFAVLSFYFIIMILDSEKSDRELIKNYVILSIILTLSALAKPSFFQGIVPGLGLYFIFALITKGFRQHWKRFLFLAISFVPSACIIGFQFFCSFFLHGNVGEGTGIAIEFGRVLHNWSPNLGISFILAFAFPLVVLILNFKSLIRKTIIQVTIFYEFAAWAESAFLYEVGTRELHGNWLWGSYLSMFIVWMVFLIQYCDILHNDEVSAKRKRLNLIIGLPIFFMHLVQGIKFWYSFSTFC